jgi:hypothetical protein
MAPPKVAPETGNEPHNGFSMSWHEPFSDGYCHFFGITLRDSIKKGILLILSMISFHECLGINLLAMVIVTFFT